MCGIFGVVSLKSKISEEIAFKMKEKLIKRGPDFQDFYISEDKRFLIGNTRLSIIDLSPNANQPISNEDKSLWIVSNCEIYNYKILREELIKKGHKFKSFSDTEVILHLYEDEKENCLKRLRGMFSFAIYDEREKKLFIARDKFGIKPLYYYLDNDFFIFSSEVNAIISLNFVNKDLNLDSIFGFLCFGSIPFPETIFKKIKLLEPSNYLIFDGKLSIKKYYYLNYEAKEKNYEEIKERLFEILRESVKIHLLSDVPVGIFLSGGIDSSSLLYFMKENKNEINSFSIKFKEKEFDESFYSKIVSKKFETNHFEYEVEGIDMKKEIENFINFMDLPTIDGFNTYFVSKIAKENGMKVCISGLGADEIFCSYPSFFYVPKILKFKNLSFIFNFLKNEKIKFFTKNKSFEGAFFTIRGIFTPFNLKKILKFDSEFNPLIYIKNIIDKEKFEGNLIDKISFLELRTYMHNQLLRDTDNFSMCNSLEVRVPFVDEKVIEYVFKIPDNYKIDKKILKDVMKGKLPEKILNRKKMAFFFPVKNWLKNELKNFAKDNFFKNDKIFKIKEIEKLWKKFEDDKIHWSRIWAIIILNSYLENKKL